MNKKTIAEYHDQIVSLVNEGKTAQEIGKIIGYNHQYVARYLRKNGIRAKMMHRKKTPRELVRTEAIQTAVTIEAVHSVRDTIKVGDKLTVYKIVRKKNVQHLQKIDTNVFTKSTYGITAMVERHLSFFHYKALMPDGDKKWTIRKFAYIEEALQSCT